MSRRHQYVKVKVKWPAILGYNTFIKLQNNLKLHLSVGELHLTKEMMKISLGYSGLFPERNEMRPN